MQDRLEPLKQPCCFKWDLGLRPKRYAGLRCFFMRNESMSDSEKVKNVKSLSEFFQLLETIPLVDRKVFADAIDENQLPVQERELFSEWKNSK